LYLELIDVCHQNVTFLMFALNALGKPMVEMWMNDPVVTAGI
jgi:hypothetical protein